MDYDEWWSKVLCKCKEMKVVDQGLARCYRQDGQWVYCTYETCKKR